jgi:hypothetical protein
MSKLSGSNFDEFLKKEGMFEHADGEAAKKVKILLQILSKNLDAWDIPHNSHEKCDFCSCGYPFFYKLLMHSDKHIISFNCWINILQNLKDDISQTINDEELVSTIQSFISLLTEQLGYRFNYVMNKLYFTLKSNISAIPENSEKIPLESSDFDSNGSEHDSHE